MSHLSPERIAALVDEPPTPAELSHLAECADCARERESVATLVTLAGAERMRLDQPLTSWETLAPLLSTDAPLVRDELGERRSRRLPSSRAMLQAAAALVLIASGAVMGRLSAGASPLPDDTQTASVASAPDTGLGRTASLDTAAPRFASVDEARRARALYELRYQQAAAFLAASDTAQRGSATPQAMKTRLAALDRVGETMREALSQAPYDPVINGYYLTTLGQREATLRQLNTALPAGVRINAF